LFYVLRGHLREGSGGREKKKERERARRVESDI
jgi:hypothetical protein